IAQSGICSRRKAETLITEGKVKVNGKVCTVLGTKISGDDTVEVNGKLLEKEEKEYYLFYKPKGCICSLSDEHGRKTVIDYFDTNSRLYPVGRLDYDTSGVLLMTNDGDFTNKMTHPSFGIAKTYIVNLQGLLSKEDVKKIRNGFNGYQKADLYFLDRDEKKERMRFELTIYEGKNHEVKNMMEDLGHHVRRLHRKSFSFLQLGSLRPGQYRRLKPFELRQLLAEAQKGNAE
ncbi:MAG: rRNA pseudouridine synthase, partial [Erysipelotrichaceae bacterium]|nr:rRNA pseudouridine synthase [Erysipelotrichaceae bacterium]